MTIQTPRRDAPAPLTHGVEDFTPVQLLRLTRLFAGDADLPATLAGDPERPGERSWRVIASSPRLQVWLIRWPAGTSTGWHDHGGARGAFTVVSGALTEYTRSRDVDSQVLTGGEGRAFGGSHVHDVVNEGTADALSVHAYSPSLDQMTHYDLVDGRLLPAGVEQREAW